MSVAAQLNSPELHDKVFENDLIQARLLAQALHITKGELAAGIGLPAETLRKTQREHGQRAQRRLRDVVEILDRVSHWIGSDLQAWAWYRSEPLPAFGQLTAADLVSQGLAEAVKTHLSRIALGGFA